MIKNSTYIRGFSPKQRKQLEALQAQTKLKTVPDLLFYALDNYDDKQKEVERLKRIIALKQKKIEALTK